MDSSADDACGIVPILFLARCLRRRSERMDERVLGGCGVVLEEATSPRPETGVLAAEFGTADASLCQMNGEPPLPIRP
jgi:hypothetical protein